MKVFEERLHELLAECQNLGRLVALHCNGGDISLFDVGYVEHHDANFVSLTSVDKNGDLDGWLVLRSQEVQRAHVLSAYLIGLESLSKGKLILQDEKNSVTDFTSAFEFSLQRHEPVSITDSSREVSSGYVLEVGKNYIQLGLSVENSLRDGVFFIDCETIEKVELRGSREHSIRTLDELHTKQ